MQRMKIADLVSAMHMVYSAVYDGECCPESVVTSVTTHQ